MTTLANNHSNNNNNNNKKNSISNYTEIRTFRSYFR